MTHYIKEFTVHDYKGIHELTLKDIAPINILTGDNNSGKTSLLELLATTENPLTVRTWLPATRSGYSGYYGYYRNISIFEGFYYLFPCNQEEDKCVEYEWLDISNHTHRTQIKGTVFNDQLSEEELKHIDGIRSTYRQTHLFQDIEYIDVNGLRIEISNNAKKTKFVIYNKQSRLPEASSRLLKNNSINFITPADHEIYNKYINSVLKTTDYNPLLVEMLHYFDNEITGIQAIQSEDIAGAISYQILSKRHRQSLPLSAYGGGMKKAVLLLSALLQVQNGILLIDEFETGIHTSCMDQVFSLLLENALKLNVQVFMTSHSKEAISKVLRLTQPEDIQKNIALYTLYNYEGKNYVRRVDCQEAIEMEDKLGMELR